jgi:3',5'-cyclic AMP phosphodiesterase CpdA
VSRPFVLAHVSDLHVSTFGDTFHDRARIVKRSVRVTDVDPVRWEVRWEEAGWRVLHEKGARRGKIALVDPDGYAHGLPSARSERELVDPIERAAAKACRLEARRAATLAHDVPGPGAVELLFAATPKNSNVRLLRAAKKVEESDVDAVVITGDLTDDGDGFPLVEAAFQRYADARRLFAVPGNHDLYLFPMAGSGRPRPTYESKRAAWNAFASKLGLDLDPTGAWTRTLPEADAILVGLDSCARQQRRFFRHNGAIGESQLAYLRSVAARPEWKDARHRIVLLHHHVVPLPHGVGRKAPSEIGMRLDDAKTVAEVLNEIHATVVMHGHRHVSEERQPAGCNFRLLASPSLTLGCRSGDAPSFWRIELGEHVHATRVRVPLEAIEQENDPGVEPEPLPEEDV